MDERKLFLRLKLAEIEEFCRAPKAKNNGSAYITAIKASLEIQRELVELEAAQPSGGVADPTADLSPDELIAACAEGLRALPLGLLDQVLTQIGAERVPQAAAGGAP